MSKSRRDPRENRWVEQSWHPEDDAEVAICADCGVHFKLTDASDFCATCRKKERCRECGEPKTAENRHEACELRRLERLSDDVGL